jgi:hypothetical protein
MKYTRNQKRWIWNDGSSSLANLASTLARLESTAGWLSYASRERKAEKGLSKDPVSGTPSVHIQ